MRKIDLSTDEQYGHMYKERRCTYNFLILGSDKSKLSVCTKAT